MFIWEQKCGVPMPAETLALESLSSWTHAQNTSSETRPEGIWVKRLARLNAEE